MDLIKSYIVQLVKNASIRLRVQDENKQNILNQINKKLNDCDDIFPEIKAMESVIGLEEVARKLISIYKRLNSKHVDFERLHIQYSDDKDAIISALRRFIQTTEIKQTVRTNVKRTKIVFDDITSSFYEIEEGFELDMGGKPKEEQTEKVKLDDFLKKNEPQPTEEKKEDRKVIKFIDEDVEEDFSDTKPSPLEETEEIEIKQTKPAEATQIEPEEPSPIPKSFNLMGNEREPVEEPTYNIKDIQASLDAEKKTEEKEEQPATAPVEDKDESGQTKSAEEDLFPTLEFAEPPKNKDKTVEELFFEFEDGLMNNIKLVDEYLFKFLSRMINPEFENEIINKAEELYKIAFTLNHDVLGKLIKSYWLALLAIRDKKLAATKNEAEIIRSTLIIIVALIKNKDIDLAPYWANHEVLINKLTDISYEV